MKIARTSLAAALAGCATVALAAGAGRLAPIPDVDAASRHAPYEMGQCDVCHQGGAKAGAPGALAKAGNDLCFDCHDEFKKPVKEHPAVKSACVACHSPHNARKKKLLL